MATLLLAEDHPVTLWGLSKIVEEFGHSVISTNNNGINACNQIHLKQPDIALLDINLPGMSGFEILDNIKKLKIRTKVVLCTSHTEISMFNKAKELGANGYILKSFDFKELKECLERVSSNGYFFSSSLNAGLKMDYNSNNVENTHELTKLSAVELKILNLIANQQTSKKIATELFVSEKTIEAHRSNILKKLNLPKEKNTLLMWAIKNIKSF